MRACVRACASHLFTREASALEEYVEAQIRRWVGDLGRLFDVHLSMYRRRVVDAVKCSSLGTICVQFFMAKFISN